MNLQPVGYDGFGAPLYEHQLGGTMKRHRPPCPTPDKQAHRTQQRAYGAVKHIARLLNAQGEHFEPSYGYECACGAWHVTHRETWNGEPNVLLLRVPDELQAWAMERAE